MAKRILIVEDEPRIANLVRMHLTDAGWECDVAPSAADARVALSRGGPDLVVLDLMLPDGDGLDICRGLREENSGIPILVLTARSSETDRVVGLELGADDYLTKPFSIRELVARVRALFRRVERAETGSRELPIEVGDVVVDRSRRRVTVVGRPVELTAREFDLLEQFASNPGRVYTRAQLLDLVWGYESSPYEHTVNSHINRLRAKIEDDPSEPRYIETVWGVGYRFYDPDSSGEESA